MEDIGHLDFAIDPDLASSLAELDQGLQGQLPDWAAGLPLDSAPAVMINDLLRELEYAVESPDGPNLALQEVVRTKLDMLEDFHTEQEDLQALGLPPEAALKSKAETMRGDLSRGVPPYEEVRDQEFGPYLEAIVDAYRELYEL